MVLECNIQMCHGLFSLSAEVKLEGSINKESKTHVKSLNGAEKTDCSASVKLLQRLKLQIFFCLWIRPVSFDAFNHRRG